MGGGEGGGGGGGVGGDVGRGAVKFSRELLMLDATADAALMTAANLPPGAGVLDVMAVVAVPVGHGLEAGDAVGKAEGVAGEASERQLSSCCSRGDWARALCAQSFVTGRHDERRWSRVRKMTRTWKRE